MFIKDYISKDYPAFSRKDSIEEASEVAKEFGYSHVFIVSKGVFLGGLSQSFLEDSPEGKLDSLNIHYERFAIIEDSSILDSIKLFHTFNANVIPVISKEEKYLGYISCDDIFNEFSKMQIDLIGVERKTLEQLHVSGMANEEILRKMEKELDLEELRLQMEMYNG